jgi:hypothetical protein
MMWSSIDKRIARLHICAANLLEVGIVLGRIIDIDHVVPQMLVHEV